MEIQSASVNLSNANVREQAAVKVQSMALDTVKEQAAAVEKLISSAEIITNPNLGKRINTIA
jgi:hypothetical protein